ncbi:MAG TPA: hypothetical protein VII06_34945 [Chloroflexota bacterium]|jgi:hypothetical protein
MVLSQHVALPEPAIRLAQPQPVRIPLATAGEAPPAEALPPCERCGSRGFTIHQRTWKRVKDPHLGRALVVRYLCKRCGYVRRAYPAGIGASRQSRSLKHLSVLLYWLGLSYQGVRAVLVDFGCPLSTTSIRRNVEQTRRTPHLDPPLSRLRVQPVGNGVLRGPDGLIALRLVRESGEARALEAVIAPGPAASDLDWRLLSVGRWLAHVFTP